MTDKSTGTDHEFLIYMEGKRAGRAEASSYKPWMTSIADLIPKWYESGTKEQMLDEALAQIRLLESRLASHAERKGAEQPADAWLIERSNGKKEVVLSPLTDDTYMDEGDCAYPLYRGKEHDE